MAEVQPFRGIRYSEKTVRDFSRVVAPPYDVISPEQRAELRSASPYNVVRIELPEGEGQQRYQNGREIYRKWIRDGVLAQDESPSIYPYYQEFVFEERKYKRKGFIAAVKVEDFQNKVVFPHERTFKKHKDDRLALTVACESNLSQIFCVYPDASGETEENIDKHLYEPILDLIGEDGIRNTMWKISDPDVINQVRSHIADRSLLIADGHHRYETSINYRNLKREQNRENNISMPYDYVMTYLSRGEGEGLIINPTHRMAESVAENLVEKLGEDFDVEKISPEEATVLKSDQISVVTRDPERTLRLSPRAKSEKNYENLAVIILHTLIFGKLADEEKAGLRYSKSAEEVYEKVRSGNFEAGFLLPGLRSENIFEVVLDGNKMPHKTTYFYPKILSGMVFNPLW